MTAARAGGTFRRTYDVCGRGLTVVADRPALADAVDTRLQAFRSPAPPPVSLVVEFHAVADSDAHTAEAAPAAARPVYDSALVATLYEEDRDRLYLACGASARVACRLSDGHTIISYVEREAPRLGWLLSHALLTVPLMESLKRQGVYALHAAGVAREGIAMLFAGASGSGKTTLALALARAGFDFLGDDIAFLAPGADGLHVLAFPDEIDVTEETAGLLPELAPVLERPVPPGRQKRGLSLTELYPVRTPARTSPGLLFFPSVSRDMCTRLAPLAPGAAFLALAPNVLLTEAASTQAHLDALARLVSESRSYRLETGPDLTAVAAMLGALVSP